MLLTLSGCAKEQEAVDIFQETSQIPSAEQMPLPSGGGVGSETVLHMNLPEISSLHPLAKVSEEVANLFSLLYDPAIKVNEDGSYSANVIEDWEISEDELEYIFHIRRNVAFHEQTLGCVDAEDILYCLDFIINQESAALHQYADVIESYEKIDEFTIKVRTTTKRNLLFLFSFYVVPKEYYASKNSKTMADPIGTGAYSLQLYEENERMVLVRNENWWKTAPVYRTIELTPVAQEELALGSSVFESYEILFTDSVTAGSLGITGKTNVNQIRTPYLSCLVPNVYNSAMSDANLRKAIAYGINRTEMISAALMGLGEATLTPLNDNFWAVSAMARETSAHDQKLALQYLQQAGYERAEDGRQYKINSDGTRGYLNIRLLYTPSSGGYDLNKAVAQSIKKSLEAIGIGVTLVRQDAETYLKTLEDGSFQIALCQFYTCQDQDISFLFNENCNYGNFYDSTLRQALNACKEAVGREAILQAYTQLQSELQEKMPVIGLYYKEHCLITADSVSISSKLSFSKIFQNINEWKEKESEQDK